MSEVEVFDALKYRVVVNQHGARGYYNSADQLHRTDGPAVIWADGTKLWFQNGQCHRTNGPAIEFVNGTKEWYINGERLTKTEFNQVVKSL